MAARFEAIELVRAADGFLVRFYEIVTWRGLWLPVAAAAFFIVLGNITPFALVLREDAYNFAVKGMEISLGDFSLDRPQAIGWPLLLGMVFSVMSVDNVFEAMYVSRWVSIGCTALGVVALGKACGVMFSGRAQKGLALAIVLVYVTTPTVYTLARNAMSESLFILCVMGVVYFTARAGRRGATDLRSLAFAALFAAASYYVRPNGLFVFAALLLAAALFSWGSIKSMVSALSVPALVFVASISPYLYARFAAFGSPFDYGPNSKYFVEHYEHVWADNVASPSFWEFVHSHDIDALYQRFIESGLLSVLHDARTYLLGPPWPVIALAGGVALFAVRKRQAYVVPLVLAVSIAGMSLVYAIFVSVRHLFYFVPLMLLCAGAIFYVLDRYRLPLQGILATAAIAAVVTHLPTVNWMGPEQRLIPQVQDHWAVWAANNIEGKVAVVEGGDFIKMSQHYQRTGWRVPRRFADVTPHIQVWRPGVYQKLEEAMTHFEEKEIRYVITDHQGMKRRPYLREISHPRWSNTFKHLGYFHVGSKGSKISRVNIYEILY